MSPQPPDGNPVPVGDKEYLVGEAQKMYRELSKESGEFFDFMIEHDLFDLESKTWKARGRILARHFLSTMHRSSSQLQRHGRRCECPDPRGGPCVAGFTAAKFQKILELCHSTSEIAEIHSMSMELWTLPLDGEILRGPRGSSTGKSTSRTLS